jgi:predicted RNase H-like HicB family nuclease
MEQALVYPCGYNRCVKFIVTYEPDEDGGYVIECPALPGCVSHGDTLEDALANISVAIGISLRTRIEHGLPLDMRVAEVEVAV